MRKRNRPKGSKIKRATEILALIWLLSQIIDKLVDLIEKIIKLIN